MITLIVLLGIAAVAIIATFVTTLRDGHRRTPDRAGAGSPAGSRDASHFTRLA